MAQRPAGRAGAGELAVLHHVRGGEVRGGQPGHRSEGQPGGDFLKDPLVGGRERQRPGELVRGAQLSRRPHAVERAVPAPGRVLRMERHPQQQVPGALEEPPVQRAEHLPGAVVEQDDPGVKGRHGHDAQGVRHGAQPTFVEERRIRTVAAAAAVHLLAGVKVRRRVGLEELVHIGPEHGVAVAVQCLGGAGTCQRPEVQELVQNGVPGQDRPSCRTERLEKPGVGAAEAQLDAIAPASPGQPLRHRVVGEEYDVGCVVVPSQARHAVLHLCQECSGVISGGERHRVVDDSSGPGHACSSREGFRSVGGSIPKEQSPEAVRLPSTRAFGNGLASCSPHPVEPKQRNSTFPGRRSTRRKLFNSGKSGAFPFMKSKKKRRR